jgi:ClpP class serine protease
MRDDEKAYVQNLVTQMYDRFLGIVSEARGVPKETLKSTVADGRVVTGREALAAKLVDQIGYVEDAYALARELGKAADAGGGEVSATRSACLTPLAWPQPKQPPNQPKCGSISAAACCRNSSRACPTTCQRKLTPADHGWTFATVGVLRDLVHPCHHRHSTGVVWLSNPEAEAARGVVESGGAGACHARMPRRI